MHKKKYNQVKFCVNRLSLYFYNINFIIFRCVQSIIYYINNQNIRLSKNQI